ncbi:MAG: hypothetical protein QOE65_916 [Solirubrobacteraceae bacterium]|nr:hypothetical protein [Solirubrobacteraceae bacterium]
MSPSSKAAADRLAWAASLAPLLIALPVLYGIGRTLLSLLGAADPFVDYSGVDVDAHAVHLGVALYADPNSAYSGQPYTPLFPWTWGALDAVKLWRGWGLLLVLISEAGLMALAGALAFRPRERSRGELLAAATCAVGAAGLAFWLVAFVPFNFLFAQRVDNPSWALALGGLLLVPAAARGSNRAAVAAGLLLTLGFWTKQSAVFGAVAAVAYLALAALAGATSWRRVAGFAGALAGLNVATFAALDLASGGWVWTMLVTMPNRHAVPVGFGDSARDLLRALAGVLALLAVVGAALAAAGGWRPSRLPRRRPSWPAGHDAQLALALGVFVVVGLLPAIQFRRAEGAVHNQYLGIAWALCLLLALALGHARRRPLPAGAAALAVVAAFAVSESARVQRRVSRDLSVQVPAKYLHARVAERPAALRDWARGRRVYHPVYTDVGVDRPADLYPGHDNVQQLLASGYQPGYLVRALLERRFDAVFLLQDSVRREVGAGTGRWEDNYTWKLDEVVRAKYDLASGMPRDVERARHVPSGLFPYDSPGLYVRRPGPDPAPWMARCFGPFHLGPATWEIRRGGGFWCRRGDGRSSVVMRRTRALQSELRTDQRAAWMEGEVVVDVPRELGRFELRLGEYAVSGERAGRDLRLVVSGYQRRFAQLIVPSPRVRIRLAGAFATNGSIRPAGRDAVAVRLPFAPRSRVSLVASSGSDASFDVSGLRLR